MSTVTIELPDSQKQSIEDLAKRGSETRLLISDLCPLTSDLRPPTSDL